MRYKFCCFLIIIICFSCQTKYEMPQIFSIHNNWSFKKTTDSVWLNATVPGNVHSDLLNNKLIEDPFIKANELNVQWISETDWEYKTQFSVEEGLLEHKNILLNFEGLDTYASVYLNDTLILESNNAFRKYNVNVKSKLRLTNDLRIVFTRTSVFEEKEKAKLYYTLPEGDRMFTRKAQFQYGWDWGPILNTSGIWRPITITAFNDIKIEDVFIKQGLLNDTIADLVAEIDLKNTLDDKFTFEVLINNQLHSETEIINDTLETAFQIPIKIKNPTLWWPHNLGEPYLYDITILVKKNRTVLDSYNLKKGLRTIELITEKDSIGESFYFKVNGEPTYMKGANYIPQNSMQNLVTPQHYENLLNSAVDANMNMLRIWGGGIYEEPIFYQKCDEKGILVWQDFMFACAMYPGDDAFLKNVEQEAIDNVKRLRNYASIALWCGNNENAEAWENWGFKIGKNKQQIDEIWNNYLKVFDSILPKTVANYSDKTSYWESSPKYGRGDKRHLTEGDAHDWFIWHDAYPFEHLETNVPRFMSEFGFQSFPSYEAIKYATQNDSISVFDENFKTHQKHHRGFELIELYMKRDFPIPTKDEDYVYISQVLQAHGMTKGFEAQRRAKPYNMGTLYWQLNDCWPVISWSSLDNFGNWKALHYKAKKAFNNVLVSSKLDGDYLKTYIINDDLQSHKGNLAIKIIDFDGQVIWQDEKEITVTKNSSEEYFNLNVKAEKIDYKNAVVIATFDEHSSYFYLAKPKDLALQKTEIHQKISRNLEGFTIELSSATLQKEVFLYTNHQGFFTDNFFDLLPNETKVIQFKTNAQSLDHLQIKTLNDFVKGEKSRGKGKLYGVLSNLFNKLKGTT